MITQPRMSLTQRRMLLGQSARGRLADVTNHDSAWRLHANRLRYVLSRQQTPWQSVSLSKGASLMV